MTEAIVTVSAVFTVALILVARRFHQRQMRRLDSKFEECECTTAVKRAEKMHHAVDTKIAAQDSRSDSPQHGPESKEPPTEEHEPLRDQEQNLLVAPIH